MQLSIHPDTTVGVVSLNVRQLSRSLDYYAKVLGLQIHRKRSAQAVLGAGKDDLLILNEAKDAVHYPRTTGLYHLAILIPTRLQLALSLRHLVETKTPLQGVADHWVSEAIYLADPDGNGIEIYRDRPREEWPFLDGQLQMASDPLDIQGIMGEVNQTDISWSGLPSETRIGHIHLQVSDILAADAFYSTLLGFDLMLHFGPSAGFVSAGGYHHHIGYNTWSSLGAGIPPANASGLAWFSIDLPSKAALEAVLDRLRDARWPFNEIDEGIFLNDSSGNGIILRAF